ncbi:DUF1810 domain-containing protein [Novilysobacter avium]|uniref:DUF1810 domain-containing protein n=1 Tax=Novilysobacter avium TaxID=2781023 RepID=A0A7S6ZUX9_9GAMM|nr:DUF1810 domain-containing protein [Lysobacter avium]QOW22174.1 DUF1810 domain-containing protein [Lysobacter avium]
MPTQPDPCELSRFIEAQRDTYYGALAELRVGRKRSHWICYVFPQLAGLGHSATSRRFGLSGVAEASAYLEHPVLGRRLVDALRAMLANGPLTAAEILGELDAMKFRSCLTLFSAVVPSEPLFDAALAHYFGGQPDPVTQQMLEERTDD